MTYKTLRGLIQVTLHGSYKIIDIISIEKRFNEKIETKTLYNEKHVLNFYIHCYNKWYMFSMNTIAYISPNDRSYSHDFQYSGYSLI